MYVAHGIIHQHTVYDVGIPSPQRSESVCDQFHVASSDIMDNNLMNMKKYIIV